MSWDDIAESCCQISRALSYVGDRWTLLIMRELGMGMRRFEQIQAQTGMSSRLLALRLKQMEDDQLVERRLYSDRPERYEYHATRKGKELDGVLLALRSWSLEWGGFGPHVDPSVTFVHKATGQLVDSKWQPPANGVPFTFDDCEATPSQEFQEERAAREAAFQGAKKPRRRR